MRHEDNIKIDLSEMRKEDGRWMELAYDPVKQRNLTQTVLELRVLFPQRDLYLT
jgi:hypothetical protein